MQELGTYHHFGSRAGLTVADEIWAFMAAALRLTAGASIEKSGRDKVA